MVSVFIEMKKTTALTESFLVGPPVIVQNSLSSPRQFGNRPTGATAYPDATNIIRRRQLQRELPTASCAARCSRWRPRRGTACSDHVDVSADPTWSPTLCISRSVRTRELLAAVRELPKKLASAGAHPPPLSGLCSFWWTPDERSRLERMYSSTAQRTALILALIGFAGMGFRYHVRHHGDWNPSDSVWRLSYVVECESGPTASPLTVAGPRDTRYARVVRQDVRTVNFVIAPRPPAPSDSRVLELAAEEKGESRLVLRCDIHLDSQPTRSPGDADWREAPNPSAAWLDGEEGTGYFERGGGGHIGRTAQKRGTAE